MTRRSFCLSFHNGSLDFSFSYLLFACACVNIQSCALLGNNNFSGATLKSEPEYRSCRLRVTESLAPRQVCQSEQQAGDRGKRCTGMQQLIPNVLHPARKEAKSALSPNFVTQGKLNYLHMYVGPQHSNPPLCFVFVDFPRVTT